RLGGDVGLEPVGNDPLHGEAHAVHGDGLAERKGREGRVDPEAMAVPGASALADAAPRLDDAREHAPVIARGQTPDPTRRARLRPKNAPERIVGWLFLAASSPLFFPRSPRACRSGAARA